MKYYILFAIIIIIIYIKLSQKPQNIIKPIKDDITVVTLNYKRPHNMIKQINTLLEYENIKQIVVCHGDPNAYRKVVQNVPNNYKIEHTFDDGTIGGAIRFEVAKKYARYDKILFLDDDMLPSESLVNDLGTHCKSCPILLGNLTRKCNEDGYSSKLSTINDIFHADINYDIVLTPIMMTNRYTLIKVFDKFQTYYPLFKETRGNGEDIIFNLCFKKIFNKKPMKLNGNYTKLDTKTHSYSSNPTHLPIRNEICKRYS